MPGNVFAFKIPNMALEIRPKSLGGFEKLTPEGIAVGICSFSIYKDRAHFTWRDAE